MGRTRGSARCAQRQADATEGLEKQDLRWHDPGLVGLRPRPVQGRRAGLRHGLSGWRRVTGYVPTVFDNLIAKGEMPVTVGMFIHPGKGRDEAGRGSERRIRHALRPVRAIPARGDPPRGREDGKASP